MRLIIRKRFSTLKQYRELENVVKDGIKGCIFWAVLMIVAGNNYLN